MASAQAARRAVLFDAVGTLIYADPPVAAVYQTVAQSHDVELSHGEVATRINSAIHAYFSERSTSSESIERERWRTIVADVFREWPERVEPIFADLWQHFALPTAWRLYDDVDDCISQLRSHDIQIGIASNFDARLRHVCQGHDALHSLDIYCSSELGFAKPHVNFFRAIESRLDLPPQSLTMVGDDRQADHDGALTAGWNSIYLARDIDSTNGSITSLRELPSLLAQS